MNIKPIMKKSDTGDGALNGIIFYPAERVQEIFDRLKAARGTPRETAELRIFADRMEWLYKNQSGESDYLVDYEELTPWAAYGEAAEDAERTAKLEGEVAHV